LAEEFRKKIASSLEVPEPESLALAIVPAFNQPVKRLTRKRRQEFRAFLLKLIDEAVNAGAGSVQSEQTEADSANGIHSSITRSACATCRGYCCRNGGVHAHLDIPAIRKFMDANPELKPHKVARAYLSKLPSKSFEHSCVYHGESGCGLPREMRSETCNSFYCDELRAFQPQFRDNQPRQVLVVATNGEVVNRSSIVTQARDHER
jgi:hypothetical protein